MDGSPNAASVIGAVTLPFRRSDHLITGSDQGFNDSRRPREIQTADQPKPSLAPIQPAVLVTNAIYSALAG